MTAPIPDYMMEDAKALGILPHDVSAPTAEPKRNYGSAAALYAHVNREGTAKRLGASVARGVAQGVNELGRSAKWLAQGAGAAVFGEPGSVAKWWESQERVDGLFDDEDIDRLFGVRRDGVAGVVESIVQFGVGFAGLSKVTAPLKALATVGKAGKAARVAATGLAAAGADAFAFDPDQQRLSDVAIRLAQDDGPRWLANPLTEYLASAEDDSQAERRFKNALEGFVTGSVIDGLVIGLKGAKRFQSKGAKKSRTPKTATEAITGEASGVDDVLEVVETPNGFELKVRGEADAEAAANAAEFVLTKGTKSSADAAEVATTAIQGVRFSSRAQAENVAATINMVARDSKRAPTYMDGISLAKVMDQAERFRAARTPEAIERLFDDTGLNLNYLDTPEDGEQFIAATAKVFTEQFQRKATTDKELRELASSLYSGENADAIMQGIANKFDAVGNVGAYMLAHRTYIVGLEKHARKLTAIINANPENSVAVESLMQTLDRMIYAEVGVTRTASELARGLRSMQLNPAAQSAMDGADGVLTKAADGEGAAITGMTEAGSREGLPGAGAETATNDLARLSRTPFSDLVRMGGWSKSEMLAFTKQVFYTVQGNGDTREALLRALDLHMKASRAAGGVKDRTFWQLLNDYRTNALLSGPRTHLTNIASNTLIGFQKPATMWWAGVTTKNKELRQQGWDTAVGLMANLHESLKLAVTALKDGKNALDDVRTADLLEQFGDASNKEGFGIRLMNLPSRLLIAEDEFFKQMNYRATVRAQALRQARMEGITDPKTIAQRIEDAYTTSVSQKGAGINTEALQYAREATLSEKLRPGTVGYALQQMAQEKEWVRFIVPFVRTPVNVMRFLGNMTPGVANFFSTTYREAIEAGGERAAIAQANVQLGTMLWLSGFLMAADGQITGRGPKDPDLRRMLESTGWRPYSIRVPDPTTDGGTRYVSYRRAEPTLAPLALTADIVQMLGEVDEQDAGGIVSASLAGVLSAVFSKSYLQGLVDTMEALASGDQDRVARLIGNAAGSFIPNLASQLNPDDEVRDTRPERRSGIFSDIEQAVNMVAARVPGFSDNMETRRNIFGEKMLKPPTMYGVNMVNPFTISRVQDDEDVMLELSRISWLRGGISVPPTELEGVSLRDRDRWANDKGQSPYDRWLELHQGGDGVPPLRESIGSLVRSEEWQSIPEGDEQYAPGGLKFQLVADLVVKYRDFTKAKMLSEFPEVAKVVAQNRALKGVAPALSGESLDGMRGLLDLAR